MEGNEQQRWLATRKNAAPLPTAAQYPQQK
jgi:hypothetical protein